MCMCKKKQKKHTGRSQDGASDGVSTVHPTGAPPDLMARRLAQRFAREGAPLSSATPGESALEVALIKETLSHAPAEAATSHAGLSPPPHLSLTRGSSSRVSVLAAGSEASHIFAADLTAAMPLSPTGRSPHLAPPVLSTHGSLASLGGLSGRGLEAIRGPDELSPSRGLAGAKPTHHFAASTVCHPTRPPAPASSSKSANTTPGPSFHPSSRPVARLHRRAWAVR
jgi:hypothetical protein